MNTEIDEVRELTDDELDSTQGGVVWWAPNAIGAVVGAVSGGAGAYLSSGGSLRSAAIGALGGAVAGGVFPWSTVRSAAQSFGRSVISGGTTGAATGAANAVIPPTQ